MNLTPYISELLYENNRVIIPEFGGLICVKTNTTIHPVEHKFYPPLKEIYFDQNIKENDNLLINYIAIKENISEDEAIKLIGDFVITINKELKEGKKVQLHDIGFLFIDISGKTKLDFDKKNNYLIDSFGLSTITSPAIQRKEVKENMIEEAVSKVKVKKSKTGILISIAAFVIIIVVSGILKWDTITNYFVSFKNDNVVEAAKDITAANENESEIIADVSDSMKSSENSDPDTVNIKISDENQIEEIEISQDIKSESEGIDSKNYYIIAGCFSSTVKAEKYLKKLKTDGFEASIQGQTPKGLYRVCFSGYQTEEEAAEALNKINSSGKYNGWILKIN